MKSAIELYQEAYNLHFRDSRPDLAKELYREIIDRFPDSDERKYAQFLIARISPPSETPHQPSSSTFSIVASISILFCIIAIAGSAGLFYLFTLEKNSSEYIEQIYIASNLMQKESYDEALVFLQQAKLIQPKRLAAYSLSSQIYIIKNRFDLADTEYKILLSIAPNNIFAQEQLAQIAKKQKDYQLKQQAETEKEIQSLQDSSLFAEDKKQAETPVKSKKESKTIDNSNVNYF